MLLPLLLLMMMLMLIDNDEYVDNDGTAEYDEADADARGHEDVQAGCHAFEPKRDSLRVHPSLERHRLLLLLFPLPSDPNIRF